MKMSIVGIVGLPSNYGGFETLVEYLVKERRCSEINYTVYCSKSSYKTHPTTYRNAKLIYIPLKANGIQSILYDILAMIKSIRGSDTILILGVSGCIFLPVLKLFSKVKIITNIDGLEHKRDKWNKYARKFLKFSEKIAVKYSDVIIADNKGIADYVKSEYNVTAEVIAYGGDHVEKLKLTHLIKEKYALPERYAFKVCRIEPENNVELILDSFLENNSLFIVVVGNWNSSEYGMNLKNKFSNKGKLLLLDAIYDKNVLDQLRSNCHLYVHGHSAGGTNPSLVEAMNLGLPIFCYDVVYNRETTKNKAIYFSNQEDLLHLLNKLDSLDLDAYAKKMHDIAKLEYSWSAIVKKYESLYE
jgi:glycosyltransferase involved in cell wall biosynthesis